MQLDTHAETLLEDYRQALPQLEQLEQVVVARLQRVLTEQHLEVGELGHRVKTEDSLRGKLERKGSKYRTLTDITDLLGVRVVTFYTSDVDKVAALLAHEFDVDWDNSVDKRKLHDPTSFGYSSLHYVCRLKEGSMPFELQVRTALQHVWSVIEHDIGYKSIVKIPPEFRRQFSRISGMLELVDDEFTRLRDTMTDYQRQMKQLVASGRLDEVSLSDGSFSSFLELKPFDRLNRRIASINQSELFPASLVPYLKLLEDFKLKTLADLQRFIDDNSEDAYQLALAQLAATDLDILSESIALQNLCLVHVLKAGVGMAGLKYVYDTIMGKDEERSQTLAEMTMQQARSLPFMHNRHS